MWLYRHTGLPKTPLMPAHLALAWTAHRKDTDKPCLVSSSCIPITASGGLLSTICNIVVVAQGNPLTLATVHGANWIRRETRECATRGEQMLLLAGCIIHRKSDVV